MTNYIDWEYYNSLSSEITESDFEKYELKAEKRLDVFTHMRASNFMAEYDSETATSFQKFIYDCIRNTTCDVMNALFSQDNSINDNSVASVSNDGYSESYRVVTQEDRDTELKSIIVSGLSGTGLAGAL